MSSLEEKLREEVDFWRRFIDQWKRVNKTPPLPRMLEALAYAEHKLQQYVMAAGEREQDTDSTDRFRH